MAGEFDKDFGYLTPFIDKIAAAAGSLADQAARAELVNLMADEKRRWLRIRELLAGAAGQAGAPSSPIGAVAKGGSETVNVGAPPAAREPFSFTVGSLRPTRNKE